MLQIYLRDKGTPPEEVVPDGMEVITDVDVEFTGAGAPMTEEAKQIVKEVDEGELKARDMFVDRFGRTLSTNRLSAGSKAGLLVIDGRKAVDLMECSINAISSIIKNCKTGCVVMYNPMTSLIEDDDTPADAFINGHHFRTIGEVNHYFSDGIFEEAWNLPENED